MDTPQNTEVPSVMGRNIEQGDQAEQDFLGLLRAVLIELQNDIHATAVSKGWWDLSKKYPFLSALLLRDEKALDERSKSLTSFERAELLAAMAPNKAEKVALMHSELSEVLEGLRHGNPPDDKIPQFSAEEAELADTIIRILDHAAYYKLDVIGALVAKAKFNKSRPAMHGGKKF